MTDDTETTMVEATAGPYAGKRLSMSKADAAAAIADGWAFDPFKTMTDEEREAAAKKASELTEEQRAAIEDKAEAAARKLRGEDDKADKPADKPSTKTRDMEADRGGDYETRAPAPKRK